MNSENPLPAVPPQRGIFQHLPNSHYRVVVRKSQGYSQKQIAAEFGLAAKTVSAYADRAKEKLGFFTFQEVQWAFYSEYAPAMWNVRYGGHGKYPLDS